MTELDPSVKGYLKSIFYGVTAGVGTSIANAVALFSTAALSLSSYETTAPLVMGGTIALGIIAGYAFSNSSRNPKPLVSIPVVIPAFIESNETIIKGLDLVL